MGVWACDATEPRLAVVGAELRATTHDWEWVWRGNFGIPLFVHCRPRGYRGLPAVESQATYLARLKLLGVEERAALPPDAFTPEAVNPFLIDEDRVSSRNDTPLPKFKDLAATNGGHR